MIEWGKTARAGVRATFGAERQLRERCLGVVLNKVNLRKIKSYENAGSESFHSNYSDYFKN